MRHEIVMITLSPCWLADNQSVILEIWYCCSGVVPQPVPQYYHKNEIKCNWNSSLSIPHFPKVMKCICFLFISSPYFFIPLLSSQSSLERNHWRHEGLTMLGHFRVTNRESQFLITELLFWQNKLFNIWPKSWQNMEFCSIVTSKGPNNTIKCP